MRLSTAYVRFFRAFNYDYLRKAHPNFRPDPWDEYLSGSHYPYVRIPIEPTLTCVVGANESGKSQLLDVIELALGKGDLTPADFCRYSDFFTVSGEMRVPEAGLHFDNLNEEESAAIQQLTGSQQTGPIQSFRMFRTHPSNVSLYIEDDPEPIDVSEQWPAMKAFIPDVVRIKPDRPLPDSVPIDYLLPADSQHSTGLGLRRAERLSLFDSFLPALPNLPQAIGNTVEPSASVTSLIQELEALPGPNHSDQVAYDDQLTLAHDLLTKVAGIGQASFIQLHRALREGKEGFANAIRVTMNSQIENSLNLAKWWSQDSRFRLAIDVRDYDLVLTISDRTGSQYTFDERSHGLKYFLSYLVQALTHIRLRTGHEVLLMDEPDTFLSNQGQQDLMRVLNEFTEPAGDLSGAQVIYVTHSPFLLDKNRGDRIRVLNKGFRDEGARVVRDVGRNHFEPLRTALGGFVGETAFIGNCNLVLEGMADQILLAGLSEVLSRAEHYPSTDYLDLNRITLVPSGSASEVPYCVYLARGRDADKPAVIVLLDGDEAGDDACRELKKGGPYGKQLLRDRYIAQIKPEEIQGLGSDLSSYPREIEDLIPVDLGVEAVKKYLEDMNVDYDSDTLSSEGVMARLPQSAAVFKAIQETVGAATEDFRLHKVPFARYVVEECRRKDGGSASEIQARFAVLFRHLTFMQRAAERELSREAISARIDRETSRFFRDKFSTCTKADVAMLLETIDSVIDEAIEGEALVRAMIELRAEFELEIEPHARIKQEDHSRLEDRIKRLKYEDLRASQPQDGHSAGEQSMEPSDGSDGDHVVADPVPEEASGSDSGEVHSDDETD